MGIVEVLKVLVFGIVEGFTEWLPISSTGHMLLVGEFLTLDASSAFKDMFFVVIQLGAILAVVLLFWKKMFPFQFRDKTQPVIRKDIFSMWMKVVVACIPGAIVTILFDDYIEAHFHTPQVIAAALIVGGFFALLAAVVYLTAIRETLDRLRAQAETVYEVARAARSGYEWVLGKVAMVLSLRGESSGEVDRNTRKSPGLRDRKGVCREG